MVPGWFRAFRLELVSNDKIILCDSPTTSYGSGMVPGWFRAFRSELVSSDKIILCDSPTASYGSGMDPEWLHAFHVKLVLHDKNILCDSPTASDGSGVVPGWLPALRLKLAINDKIILCESPMASDGSGMAPGWIHALRFGLVSEGKSHFRRRPRLPPTPAATLGPARGSADARVMPRRSGPKRLGCKRAAMELAAHLAQGQCLRLLPCAEAAILRVQPHVAELLLRHGQLRSGGQSEEYDSSWSASRNKTPPDFLNQN